MRRPLIKALILISLILTLFTACDHNVYMGNPRKTSGLWKVVDEYFDSLQEAMDYIYETTKASKAINDVPAARTAILQRNVMNGERGGGLIVPEDFTGMLKIDFNTFTYEFSDSLDHFFDIKGGDEVYITNGTTVIYNEADHKPFALAVNTKTVTIDDHLIDDRRVKDDNHPEGAKLFDVGTRGSLVVTNTSSSETGATLSGVIAIATDGIEKGGKIRITNSKLVITNIFTTYLDAEGNLKDKIPSTVDVYEKAKSRIDILSGTVEIQDINQGTDYKDGSNLYKKAILNIIRDDPEDPSRKTLVKNPHKIDTIIEAVVDSVKDQAKRADKEVIHDLSDDDWTTEKDPGYPAKCTTAGLKVRWCRYEGCDIGGGKKYSETEEIPALGHLITTGWVTTDPVTHWHVCDRCHEKVGEEAHSFSEWTYDPESGLDVRDCSVCERHETETHVHSLTHVPRVPHTATTPGNIEYWHCSICNNNYADAEATIPVTDITDPHVLEHHKAVHHTCTTDGNYEYWHCTVCGLNFKDAGATTEITDIVDHATHDKMEYIPAKDATCTAKGNLEYWHCKICDKYFSDEEGHNETTPEAREIAPLNHNGIKHAAVEPTCTEPGNIKYWQCSNCSKYFDDAACTHEITQAETVRNPLGHNWSEKWTFDDDIDEDHHWHECTRCHVINEESKEEHDYEIVFDADTSARKVDIGSYCTVCEKRYDTTIASSTGAFDISIANEGLIPTRTSGNEWIVSVRGDVIAQYSSCTCRWIAQDGTTISGLEGTDPITVSIGDEMENGNYQIRCEFYDWKNDYKGMCILVLHK